MLKKIVSYFTNLWYSIIRIGSFSGVKYMRKLFKKIVSENKLSVIDIAHYFLSKEEMSSKKLQKLVYYAYAWYIALYNESVNEITNKLCTNTTFEAWIHGPVCRKLYAYYADCFGMVPKYNGVINEHINNEIKSFLDNIYEIFGKYTGDDLESMTHQEYPWQNARDNTPPSVPSTKLISERDMFTYYNNL